MNFKFYVKMDGEIFGPYSVRDLMGLGLLDDTLITEESMNGEWHQASEFNFEDLLRKEESASLDGSSSRNIQPPPSPKSNYKWFFVLVAILLIVVGVAYVFNNSAPDPQLVTPTPSPSIDDSLSPPKPSPSSPSNETLVICPMCNGTGKFDFMPGDIMAPKTQCTGCNGLGKVDQTTASEIIKLQKQLEPTLPSSGGSSSNGRDYSKCPDCYGNGKCSSCAGRGEYRYDGQYGQPGGIMDCSRCRGTGKCQTCYGSGHV